MPRWFWEKENWVSTPELTPSIFEYAKKIDVAERSLYKTLTVKQFSEFAIRAAVNDLRASWRIEQDSLNEEKLQAVISQSFRNQLNLKRSKTTIFKDKETNAALAVLCLLNDAGERINIQKICELHTSIQSDDRPIWGKVRESIVLVRDNRGYIQFAAPPTAQLESLLTQFCDWYNTDRHLIPSSIGSALVHAFFVVIHPFGDGNGRLARLLTFHATLTKEQNKYKPYSVVQQVEQNLSEYYALLRRLNEENGIQKFVEFSLKRTLDAIRCVEFELSSKQLTSSFKKSFSQSDLYNTLTFNKLHR